MGNLDIQTVTVYEDDSRRICTVVVMDLETNVAFPTSISIEKIVERRFLPKGETALRVRTNSEGKPVYTVRATEDEVFSRPAEPRVEGDPQRRPATPAGRHPGGVPDAHPGHP
jgi:hypothetical protein